MKLFNKIFNFNIKFNFGIDSGVLITLASLKYLQGVQERGFWADRIFPVIHKKLDKKYKKI